eukprot:SAG22_NODE_8696_length_636_cov_0.959032_1_plen_77_part_01
MGRGGGTLVVLADYRYGLVDYRERMQPWMREALLPGTRRDLAVDKAIDLTRMFFRSLSQLQSKTLRAARLLLQQQHG